MDIIKHNRDEIDDKANWRNKCESDAELIIKSFAAEEYLEERNNPNIVCDVHYRNFENVFIDSIKSDSQKTAERIVDNALGINTPNTIPFDESEVGSHTRMVRQNQAENRQNQGRDIR